MQRGAPIWHILMTMFTTRQLLQTSPTRCVATACAAAVARADRCLFLSP